MPVNHVEYASSEARSGHCGGLPSVIRSVQNAYHPDVTLRVPLRHIFRHSIHLIGTFSYCRRHSADDFTTALELLHAHMREISHLVADAGSLADLSAVLSRRPLHPGRRVVLRVP